MEVRESKIDFSMGLTQTDPQGDGFGQLMPIDKQAKRKESIINLGSSGFK